MDDMQGMYLLVGAIGVFGCFIFGVTYYNLRKNSVNRKKLSKKKKREMMGR